MKKHIPSIFCGSGLPFSIGNIMVVKTDMQGHIADISDEEKAYVLHGVATYIESIYIHIEVRSSIASEVSC